MAITEFEDLIQCGHIEARALLKDWDKDNHSIGGVINLAWNIEPRMVYPRWLPVLIYPADDEIVYPSEWFDPILSFYDAARKHGKVIIHCQAGGNRSRGCFGVVLRARHGKGAAEALAIAGQPGYHHWREAIEQYEVLGDVWR